MISKAKFSNRFPEIDNYEALRKASAQRREQQAQAIEEERKRIEDEKAAQRGWEAVLMKREHDARMEEIDHFMDRLENILTKVFGK